MFTRWNNRVLTNISGKVVYLWKPVLIVALRSFCLYFKKKKSLCYPSTWTKGKVSKVRCILEFSVSRAHTHTGTERSAAPSGSSVSSCDHSSHLLPTPCDSSPSPRLLFNLPLPQQFLITSSASLLSDVHFYLTCCWNTSKVRSMQFNVAEASSQAERRSVCKYQHFAQTLSADTVSTPTDGEIISLIQLQLSVVITADWCKFINIHQIFFPFHSCIRHRFQSTHLYYLHVH